MNIATLTIEMAANIARLTQDMQAARGVVERNAQAMQRAAGLVGAALGAMGVGLSLASFTGFIRGAIDAADAAGKLSARTGIATKDLAGLQLAYEQAGLKQDALANSTAKLSKEMADGGKTLEAMGIKSRTASGELRATKDVIYDVANKFASYADGASKAALAQELFGKSGSEMIPLLNGGADAMIAAQEAAEKLGLTISDETAAKAGEFNDTLDLLQRGLGGVSTRVAAELLPTLSNLAGEFLESATQGDTLKNVATGLANVLKTLYSVGAVLTQVFATVGKTLGLIGAQLVSIMRGDIKSAVEMGREWSADMKTDWAATAKTVSSAWGESGNATVESMAKTGAAAKAQAPNIAALTKAHTDGAAAAKKAAEEARKLIEDGAKLTASLLAAESGLSGDFAEKWDKLAAAYKGGARSLADMTKAQAVLLSQQPAMKAAADAQKKALEEETSAWADVRSAMLAHGHAQEQAAKSVVDGNQSLRDEIELIGLSSKEQTRVLQQRTQTIILTKQATLAELERQAAITGTMTREQIALAAEIEGLQERNELLVAQEARESWGGFWESVNSTAHDTFVNVAEEGMGAFKRIGKTLKSAVLDMLYQMTVKKWIVSISGSLTGALAGGAAQAATGGGASSALSAASTIGSLSSGVGLLGAGGLGLQAGFGALMSSGFAGIGASVTGGMAAIASGTGAGIAAGLGTIAGALGPIAAGAALLWQPLFGRKLKDSGIEGSFGGDAGFEGNSYQFLKGGLFRSNKTKRGDLDPGVSDFLSQAFKAFQTQASSFADVLGLEADKVASFTSTIKLSLNGLNEQEIKTALEGALANVSNELAQALLGDNAFGKAGEAAGETLARLAVSLSAANGWFDTLGVTLMDASLAGASAASAFVELFGSMDNFNASVGSYYENFYSEAERMGKATEALAAELGKAGVAMPATKDAYRALVTEALNAGEAGQELAAKLLQLNGAFAEVTNYAAQTAQEARDIARETHELEIELLRAQGREAEANYRQRMLEIDGLSAAQLVTYDYNAELRKTISAVGKASAALKAFSSAAQSIQTSKDTLAGVVRSPVEIAQKALNAALSQLNVTLKPDDLIQDNYTYFSLYDDVKKAFERHSVPGGPLEGKTESEYAWQHYYSSGKDEGRMSPQEALDYITTLTPNFSGMSLQDVLALDTSAQGDYSAEQWTAIAEVFARAADLTTAQNTPITPITPITPDTPAATAKDGAADAAKLIAQLGTEVSRIGLSALDLQLLEIADSAEQYRQQLKEMEHDTQANIDAVNAWAAAMTDAEKARAKAQADDMLGGLAQQIKELDWIEQEKALYGIQQQAKEYTQSLKDLGQATQENIASVEAWAKAMADAEVARNKKTADSTISGLMREVSELGMTDLQKQLSGIARQAADYVQGLKDIGQATASNITSVNAWADAMSAAAGEAAAKERMADLRNATDAAFSALQRAVDAQRTVVQETISHMQAVFDMTRDAAKALYGEVDSARTMTAAAGRAFIDNALSNAKATGYMPDADALSEAIEGARNGLTDQAFSSSFEADRDRLVLAGKLTDLKELAEPQLTEAQRQLKTLDATLENARQQIDVLRGIDVSVLSVADAVAALAVAIEAERAAKTAAATIAAATGTTAAPPTTEMPAKPGASYWTPTVVDGRNLFSDPQGYIWDMESIKTAQKLYGAPSFAVGINRVPHDMLAQIHEGEAIVPKAFNPYNPGAKSVGNERLEALVEGLTAEVQRLQSIVAKGVEHQRETAEILDNVTEGGNAMRSEVMA